MPMGPGKYDDLCTYVREKAQADGVLLFVSCGERGHGFSVQAGFELTLLLPTILRDIADEIEKTLKAGHV